MSLPYILLTLQPAWMKALPKPGVWMEKFKESMGFLLMATVVWLLGVLGSQVGAEGTMWTGMFLVIVSLSAWIVGRFTDLTSSTGRKLKVYGVAAAISIIGLYACILSQPSLLLPLEGKATAQSSGKVAEPSSEGSIPWQPFTQAALDAAIKDGKTVFVDFTADWCLTCKTNERLFLNTKEVADRIRDLNIVALKADWTSPNPEIERLLKRFNRAGVPLYTVFPSADATKPIRLPEVVTKDMILGALDQGGKSK
jgi:Thiol:disulfide interchange protein